MAFSLIFYPTSTPTVFNFDNYFDWLMGWEGTKYEVVPDDPGGATKFGIDQRSHPDVDIRNLTREEATAIYLRDYWRPSAGDKLPGRIAWAVTDCRVNCGPRASQWLQSVVQATEDGIIGPKTLAAVADYSEDAVVTRILNIRGKYYRDLGQQDRFKGFLKGWLNRNEDLRRVLLG